MVLVAGGNNSVAAAAKRDRKYQDRIFLAYIQDNTIASHRNTYKYLYMESILIYQVAYGVVILIEVFLKSTSTGAEKGS